MPCWLTKNETSVDNIAEPNSIQEEYSKSFQAASLSGNGSFINNRHYNVLIVSCYWSLIKSKVRPLGVAALYPYVSILGFPECASCSSVP